jgi:hypothetical protein
MHRADFPCSVAYDPEVACVTMIWKGSATSPLFRETNERVLACLAENRASRLLGDMTEFDLIGASDQEWLNLNGSSAPSRPGCAVALVQSTY